MPPHNLPAQPTPFVGRGRELAEITRLLLQPGCRLLTLVGPGGIGKTRLALQAAQLLANAPPDDGHFADGVFYVPLAAVTNAAGLVSTIGEAVGLVAESGRHRQQLLDFMQSKRLLLVLDNVEQVLDDLDLASDLLAAAPQVKLLLTSRESVNLQEAWFLPIFGLAFPSATAITDAPVPADGAAYDALQLFELCARRTRATISLDGEWASVARICRMVAGVPLAIELAAAWLRALTIRQIEESLARDLELLAAPRLNLAPRHRSMQVVMDQSWALLAAEEQQVVRRLVVFNGGFRYEAAEQVAGASLLHLAVLVEKCWIWLDASGRYQFHELLRQYAARELATVPAEEEEARQRHSAYYLNFVSERGPVMLRRGEQVALNEVTEELENTRQAWLWAAAQRDFAAIDRSYPHFWRGYWMTGRAQEGLALINQVFAQLESAARDTGSPLASLVVLRLIYQRGNQHYFLGDVAAAQDDYMQALDIAIPLGDAGEISSALISLGIVNGRQGRIEAAIDCLTRSIAHAQAAGDTEGVADALHELSLVYGMAGDFPQAIRMVQESLRLSQQTERLDWIAWAIDALGYYTFCSGDYEASQDHYTASLAEFRSLGHQIGIALALGGLGLAAWAKGDHGEARRLCEEGLAICRQTGHRLHMTSRLSLLAQIAADMGDRGQARRYAEEGVALATAIGNPDFGVHLRCCLAEMLYGEGQAEQASEQLRTAFQAARAANLRPRLALVLLTYARLLLLSEQLSATVRREQRARALRILAHLAQQPAQWYIFRTRAAQLAERLRAELPLDVAAGATAAGEAVDLDDLAAEIAQTDFAELRRQ
jgi:predicted ATPase